MAKIKLLPKYEKLMQNYFGRKKALNLYILGGFRAFSLESWFWTELFLLTLLLAELILINTLIAT